MIIVLDTNVLIAAFIAHGVCSDLLEHCVRRHRLVTSAFILEEFHRVMVDRLRYSAEEAQEAIELLRSRAMLVAPAELGTTVCRDKDDDAVLGTPPALSRATATSWSSSTFAALTLCVRQTSRSMRPLTLHKPSGITPDRTTLPQVGQPIPLR